MSITPKVFAVAAIAITILAAGCSTQPVRNPQLDAARIAAQKAQEQNKALADENAALKAALAESKAKIDELNKALADSAAKISGSAEEIDRLQKALEDLGAVIRGNGVGVPLRSDILFDSGKTVIKDAGKKALDDLQKKIEGVLVAGKFNIEYIRIDGHTDSDPIKATADQFKDNWMLGAARANAVREHLQEIGGLSDTYKLYIASYADTVPVDPGTTAEAKVKNRRVEIFIVPAAK